jgi:hypothetical protein
MPEHIQYQDDDLFNPETHHEESDVPIKPLFWAIFIFVVFGIVTHVVLAFMYKSFANAERKRMDPPYTQVARPENAYVPQNQPLLQPFPHKDPKGRELAPNQNTPVTDLTEMRAREERELHSYGWVDREHGVARIPIEEAKKRVLSTLPVGVAPPPPPPPPPAPTTTGGPQ